jgi:hypothetical protein
LRRFRARSSYETAYNELARMMDVVQEKSWTETAASEMDRPGQMPWKKDHLGYVAFP